MATFSRRVAWRRGLALGLAILVLGAGGRAAGAAGEAKAKAPATAGKIDFKVSLSPLDPFSNANRVGSSQKEFRPGEVIRLTITGTPAPGYHTYPLTRRTEAQDEVGLCTLSYEQGDAFQPLWPVTESPAEFVDTKGLGVWLEHEKPFTWEQDVLVKPTAKEGPAHLRFTVRTQVCNENQCTWGDYPFDIPLEVKGSPLPVPREVEARLKDKEPPPEVVPVPPSNGRGEAPAGPEAGPPAKSGADSGLWAFILQGIIWGAISLVTPCVFPMIPITVSFFLKQSEKQVHWPVTTAAVYCATIVVVLTTSAVALLSFFTAVSTHPLTNYGMGALFIFFALSLFGMYEIELPHSLAQFTSSREGQGGLVGTVFMALTFTIISFACVAPFLGGFGGTAAESSLPWSYRVFGGLAFSSTFAAPFFVLALFPSLLKKMPRSGSWLNSVKVVMGFLELAAAFKFLRAGELVWLPEPTFFTYDLVMGLYVALCFLCGLYLLNAYRLPHDTPAESLGVPRLLFATAFLTLGIYLTPALFKVNDRGTSQRPGGAVFAWVDSFLLPEGQGTELPWTGNLDRGLAQARERKQLVFVDFTGKTCTNCAYNERNVFSKPAVRDLMQKYTLVQLYTDLVPNKYYPPEDLSRFGSSTTQQTADARANRAFQAEKFNDTRLPLYVILQPQADGGFKEVSRYDEGKINDPEGFVEFLRRPLAAGGR
jgi:thiol:disulfide interchange protein DsbD